MVKMVRNAYEMAIPEKNGRFFIRKINEKVLELGRDFSFLSSDYHVWHDFLRQIDW